MPTDGPDSGGHVHETWTGPAEGGPLHEETLHVWAPKGPLVVSESTRQTWVYDHDLVRGVFVGRDTGTLDSSKLTQAQDDGGRCVMVID